MVPAIVLVTVTVFSFVLRSVRPAGVPLADRIATAAAHGMAAMFLVASSAHFLEPLRSGLEAIVPAFVPFPAAVVAASGVFELLLAAALAWRTTRPLAAATAFLYLVAIYPANVIAATTAEHSAAPDTPLGLRTLIQIVFMAASAYIALHGGIRTQVAATLDALKRALGGSRRQSAPLSHSGRRSV